MSSEPSRRRRSIPTRALQTGRLRLRHRTESDPDSTEKLTVFLAAADETTLLSTWLTVEADCVSSLDSMR